MTVTNAQQMSFFPDEFTPRSLLARTALVIVFALIASQVVSVLLFRYYSQMPRIQLVAAGYISHLKTIRAALESIPPEQHRDFFVKLREERGIRVIPPQRIADEPLEPAPNTPAIMAARERLRDQFGPEADIFVFQRPQRAARFGVDRSFQWPKRPPRPVWLAADSSQRDP